MHCCSPFVQLNSAFWKDVDNNLKLRGFNKKFLAEKKREGPFQKRGKFYLAGFVRQN